MTERPPPSGTGSALWKRWPEVDPLFEAALDLPEPRRRAFLREQCGADAELFQLVAELLEIAEETDGPVDRPGPSLLRAALAPGPDAGEAGFDPGQRIGRYRILGELGRGGMATVYEAERADDSVERPVAIKVLRHHTDDVVRRFMAERQILSSLAHPNIARLLDGGATEDGRPYLVMDRVTGRPITRWADARRLSVDQRLRLFLQVADAVHHAHQRLVVHRDLKPSNILVTGEGRVMLLDFGIAKLLSAEGDDALTGLGPRPLTPHYASPEQLSGEPVTTRSDVYQLGILLHVLLTGSRPHDRSPSPDNRSRGDFTKPSAVVEPSRPNATGAGSDAESVEAVADARSTSPPSLHRTLRGDLDTIVLEALRPEPALRYDSAAALADDVRRYLAGRPITTRRASIRYRLSRLLRRNRWLLPAAALIGGALATLPVTQARHSRQLERERNETGALAERAERLYGFIVSVFTRPEEPLEVAREAVDLDLTIHGAAYPSTALKHVHVAQALDALGRLPESIAGYRVAQPGLERTLGPDHFNTLRKWNSLGTVLMHADDAAGAEAVHRRILESRRRIAGTDTTAIRNLASAGLRQHAPATGRRMPAGAAALEDDMAGDRDDRPTVPQTGTRR